MNRTDRLLAIVLELQGKGKQRAEDLAATFEVTKRTIYRDVLSLCEAGVPIVSTPGQGYTLVEGYFLPPLRFSTEEAILLLLGSDFIAQSFDAQYRAAAFSAIRKIEAVIPPPLLSDVRYLQTSIRFMALDAAQRPAEIEMLQQLRRAIIEQRQVGFRYHARFTQDQQSKDKPRRIDPLGIAHVGEAWYLVGHDHARDDLRRFRLERMDDLKILDKRFSRPADFTIERSESEQGELIIQVWFDSQVARWVKESRFYYVVAMQDQADGLLVTMRARHEDEVLHWLLGWGQHVRVIEPASLRERLIAEARGVLKNYETLLT
jgi:predicted DNA-binding transcriptional regulator YafY